MSFTGTAETGPTRVGVAIGDLTSGMWLAIGILSAWIEKEKSGQGRAVETSLLASLVGLLSVQGQRFLSLGEVPCPTGNVHPVIAPYGVFRARDGDLNIGAATQDMWLKLCDALALTELKSDARFSDNASRMQNRDLLRDIINDAIASDTKKAWSDRLVEVGIPAGPINTLTDVFEDEQVRHLGLVETFEHPTLGSVRQVSNPLSFSGGGEGWIRRAPPALGQHTREVLREFGIDSAQIDEWESAGAILQAPQSAKAKIEAA
jgi:crotonobetainyl-CoA:carnitine CoA-transferase CaiB-like acyl-CoA transferase